MSRARRRARSRASRRSCYALAGERINLNSGPQLARVLFEKLGLKPGRRTKTGFSTDQAVLEELARDAPVPGAAARVPRAGEAQVDLPRRAARWRSTRATAACTPRSTRRAPRPGGCRRAIPTSRTSRCARRRAARSAARSSRPPGRVLVGADYSQIELRHDGAPLRRSRTLIEAFAERRGRAREHGAQMFGVTGRRSIRRCASRAKIVNFGIMYGMGARSLSQQMGIALAEAQEFIARLLPRVRARARVPRRARSRRRAAAATCRRCSAAAATCPRSVERARRRARARRARGDQHADPGLGRRPHEARDDPRPPRLEARRIPRLDCCSRCTTSCCSSAPLEEADAVAERGARRDGGMRRAARAARGLGADAGATWFDVH